MFFMKKVFSVLFFSLAVIIAQGQSTEVNIMKPDSTKKIQTVETSCGMCQFGMKSKDCSLAVRINGSLILLTELRLMIMEMLMAKMVFVKLSERLKYRERL